MELPAIQRTVPPVVDDGPPPPPAAIAAATSAPAVGGLAALFEQEESPLLRYALGLTGRREIAEDLVQDAFLRLQPLFAEIENPRAWLYRCVRNLALNHLRDHARESADGGAAAEAEPAATLLAAEAMGRLEAVGHMRLLLAELATEDRALLHLKYHDGLVYRDIAARTGLAIGTVGWRLHHLLKGLADALRRAGIEDSRG